MRSDHTFDRWMRNLWTIAEQLAQKLSRAVRSVRSKLYAELLTHVLYIRAGFAGKVPIRNLKLKNCPGDRDR